MPAFSIQNVHIKKFNSRESNMKKILGLYDPPPRHWVGDGFPVRSLFT